METASPQDGLTTAQKEILKRARLELCKLTDMFANGKDRLHPMSDEYEKVEDAVAVIEELLGY